MVVGPGEAAKAGGFLTGWKGIAILVSGVAVVAVLTVTGIQAGQNTFPRLSTAEADFTGGDFGFGALYNPDCPDRTDTTCETCIINGTFAGRRWVADLPIPGTRDTVSVVSLGDNDLLSRLADIDPDVRWQNNPEFVCFVICRTILGDNCEYFTYDGLNEDSCRFGEPTVPMEPVIPGDDDDFRFIYDAQCMQRRRELLVKPLEVPATGLGRPNPSRILANPEEAVRLDESIIKNIIFMKGQWAGPLPTDYRAQQGYTWRSEGFIDVDEASCVGPIESSFANGNHIVVTMATADQVALMSMALVWWGRTIEQLGSLEVRLDVQEVLRGAQYLVNTWDQSEGDNGRVLLGIGSQLRPNGLLATFEDFGRADFALQIGPNISEAGQKQPEPAECTWTENDKPDPATAAHVAAALAISSHVITNLTDGVALSVDTVLETAMDLYQYSLAASPIDGNPAPSPPFNANTTYGPSQAYPLDDNNPTQVFGHQLWAACALWQATAEERYWNDTLTIYSTYFNATNADLEASQLYTPAANYRNPQWWGLLCMAQSAPEDSNIADDPLLAVPEHVNPSLDTPGANETAAGWRAGQRADYREYLRAQLPEVGTRKEVLRQISNNFIYPWLTLESQSGVDADDQPTFAENDRLAATAADSFHYFDLNGDDEGAIGTANVVRDSANAAMVSLIYADMPGVNADQAFQARCMAKQQVDFLLGENSANYALQGFYAGGGGTRSPQNFFHKDSACPDFATRNSTFSWVFSRNPDFDPDENVTRLPELLYDTRVCDFLTFYGDPTPVGDLPNPDRVEIQASFGSQAPAIINPVLNNTNDLVGAVASTFDVTGAGTFFVDQRTVCKTPGETDCPAPNDQDPNPMTQVSIDTNAALFGAVSGVVALPQVFWEALADCPAPADRIQAAQRVRAGEIDAARRATRSAFIESATQDPNRSIPAEDTGTRVPSLSGTTPASRAGSRRR